jgi:hypothetical protein
MSSSLEAQDKGYGEPRYGEEAEGLVESGLRAPAHPAAPAQQGKSAYQDDEGILPVILEDYLERAGVM